MSSNHIYIAVCGILTRPGKSENWTGKFVTHTHIRTPHRAEKVEYFTSIFTRRFGQKKRVEKLCSTLNWYINNDFKIHLIGHSNGCDVILKALEHEKWPAVESVTLISAATKKNIDRVIPRLGHEIKSLKLMIGKKDTALKLARFGRWLGYGTLGLDGPENLPEDKKQFVEILIKDKFNHSTWFSPLNFYETMSKIF